MLNLSHNQIETLPSIKAPNLKNADFNHNILTKTK